MTDKPTPTDAELKAMWQLHAADIGGIFHYARAVLAKWGQPAQAEEPVAWKHDCAALLTNDVELWIDACPHCGKPRNAPKPVGRVPLTVEQIKDLQDDGVFLGACRQIVRAIEAEHGIKGGQHGEATPQPTQPVEREPLTPERVKEIVRGAGYDQCDIPDTERAAFINGLRHGEQNTASKEASMFLDKVWDGIKTGSLACLFAFGIYCMVVGAIITVDQLAAHITAGCEKGGQHGTE